MPQFRPIQVVLLYILISLPAFAHAGQSLTLFNNESVLTVTIRTDLKYLIEHRTGITQAQPAEVITRAADGSIISQNASISTRGRSKLSTCNFPPLRLMFAGRSQSKDVFSGMKETKIATHCDPGENFQDTLSADGEANVIQEYLVYKLYSLYTEDKSLRVRLAKIRYEDINHSVTPIVKLAFFIEDGGDAARRLDWIREKGAPLHYTDFESTAFARTMMFGTLIGHNDWRIHENGETYNSKAYRDSSNKLHLMLYDFDLSQIMGDGRMNIPLRVLAPGLMYWPSSVTAKMMKRSEADFEIIKKETSEIHEPYVCLDDSQIQDLLKGIKAFQRPALELLDSPLLASKQREYSKSIVNDFFDLLGRNELPLAVYKSACSNQ